MAKKGKEALPSESLPDAAWRSRFRRRLLAWFRTNARDLPWRRTSDPYRIWVSEIMLQQTQVAKVIDYYERFLRAFSSLRDLASADESQVLRMWEGLGYYRRARQLHRAAIVIMDEHDGRFPRQIDAIRALPGIGRYTAGAIASIAWDAREPILEANTIRVFCRLLVMNEDPTRFESQRLLWSFAESILPPRQHAGQLNQAMMELGSEICTPRQPACDRCPVAKLCPTFERGLQEEIPAQTRKMKYEDRREAAVVVWRAGRVLLRQCGSDERWAGLWDFPRFLVRSERGAELRRELKKSVFDLTGVKARVGQRLMTIKHGVTRFRITLICHQAEYQAEEAESADLRWISPGELHEYPLSVTGRQISERLSQLA